MEGNCLNIPYSGNLSPSSGSSGEWLFNNRTPPAPPDEPEEEEDLPWLSESFLVWVSSTPFPMKTKSPSSSSLSLGVVVAAAAAEDLTSRGGNI